MKILGIYGSIRTNGNSDWMIDKVLSAAENKGAIIDRVKLRDYKIDYCTGCDFCQLNGGKCVIEDDMQLIYPKLLDADLIIVACPNYFKNVSLLQKILCRIN